MAKELKDPKVFALHILDAIKKIHSYTEGFNQETFLKQELVQDGVLRQLEIIGEASGRFSKEVQAMTEDVSWKEIIAMRNKLIHDYFDVDLIIVWNTIQKDMPKFEKRIKELLAELS